MLRLRPFRQRQLALTYRWFADADTRRWLGGPGWPSLILDLHKRPLGEYRGAVETGRYSWLAWDGDTAVGYVGCDTYDRCTTWDGSPDGRGVVKTLPVPTANLSYVVDPALRRQGYGTSIIAALMASSQMRHVSLFVAGVEPANTGSISCLLKNGFQPLDPAPDWEGTVYYARERPAASAEAFVLAVATLRISVRAVFAAMFHGPDGWSLGITSHHLSHQAAQDLMADFAAAPLTSTTGRDLPWSMDVQAHEDVAAAAAAHSELGHEYEAALAEGLIERISSEIDKQVDTRLAQRGIQPTRSAWANVAMGLGSVGLGIGATAVTLHSLSSSGTVPKATVVLGPFHASVMSSTTSISTAQVVLVVLIWVVIAVVNIAYARRRLGRF